MNEVTRILQAVERGDRQAARELLPLVYDELRRLAARQLAQETPGQTLQPTALVHEAYLKLVGPANAEGFQGRRHFFGAAAEAMRRILVEAARSKGRLKRGGGAIRLNLPADLPAASGDPDEMLDLDAALQALAAEDPEKAALVELRYFAGLAEEEAAACLGISRATASRHWTYARAWLFDHLRRDGTA
jgi:RNA polymerase sigma factor (TIGR02999 family)